MFTLCKVAWFIIVSMFFHYDMLGYWEKDSIFVSLGKSPVAVTGYRVNVAILQHCYMYICLQRYINRDIIVLNKNCYLLCYSLYVVLRSWISCFLSLWVVYKYVCIIIYTILAPAYCVSSSPKNNRVGVTTLIYIRRWTYIINQYNHYKNNFVHLHNFINKVQQMKIIL